VYVCQSVYNMREISASIKHDITKAPKTGNWRYAAPVVDKEKCIGCGTCVKFCPEACIELINNEKQELPARHATRSVAGVDYEWCKGCGVCAQVCPVKAIIMSAQGGSLPTGQAAPLAEKIRHK
jgi:pyruvate ferredoxin oxidoreductase delta subunit